MLYEYICNQCGDILTAYRSIENMYDSPEHCGLPTKKIIATVPYSFVDNMEEYMCPVTNVGVTTRRQRNEIMAREGLVDANDFLKSKEFRNKQEAEVKATRKRIEAERPQEVQEQVNDWAVKELGL